jgi:alginate O-acetyltransferase complex protein AlgI
MIFSTPQFLIFFIITVFLIFCVNKNTRKKSILLAASYFFYGCWDWRFTFLMAAMTAVNYYLGLAVEHSKQRQKLYLTITIIFDLAILGFFKYYNFFIDSANTLTSGIGWTLPHLDIILPVGISFITFQVMAYVIDIYRGITPSAESIWEFALLTAFFPQLVAGPIIKAHQFLPELKKKIVFKRENFIQGGQLFMLGFFRKVIIADRLALFVDPVFESPTGYSSLTIWLAVIAYAIQIYCDFSGYSDMAIGTAKCFGYEIPINFDVPYISRNITEFWRRWHISFSTWLREYLYIPLGGNRKGKARQYINLMIVMLLGGLWHGASWNFVAWGGLHGLALSGHKAYSEYFGTKAKREGKIYGMLAWLATLLFICVTWVFFRAKDFSEASIILHKMFAFTNSSGITWYSTSLLIALPGIILADYLGTIINQNRCIQLKRFSEWFWVWFWVLGFLFISPHNPKPFVYFQF